MKRGDDGLLSFRWTRQSTPRKKHTKNTLMLFSSVSLMSRRHPQPRRLGLQRCYTHCKSIFSADVCRVDSDIFRSLHPELLWKTFSFVFYGESHGSAHRSPCCSALRAGRARKTRSVCARRTLAMVSLQLAEMHPIIDTYN